MSSARKTLKILALIYFVLGIASLVIAGIGIAKFWHFVQTANEGVKSDAVALGIALDDVPAHRTDAHFCHCHKVGNVFAFLRV